MKAFITAHKPRALAARNCKSIPYAVEEGGQQESSSSSADIGEPQTPSSQSSETALASNGPSIATQQSDDDNARSSQPVDPHFARLMASLSLSAKKIDTEPATLSHPPISEPPHKLARRHARPAIPSHHDSIQSMGGDLLAVQPTANRSALTNHSHGLSPNVLENTHSEYLNALAASTMSASSSLSRASAEPSTPSISASSASISSSPSRSPKHARRNSSTADISPYLTRPTEVPTSGKRLKQLALLELVADESSKMTPVLMNRELPAVCTRDTFLGRHPGVCASVPPPVAYETPNERYDPAFSRPGAITHYPRSPYIPSRSSFQHSSTANIHPMRPQSGQLIRHDVTTSRDRVRQQSQLLSLLGSQPEVVANGEPYRTPERLGTQLPPYFHSSTSSVQSMYPNSFSSHVNAPTLPGVRAPSTMQATVHSAPRPPPSTTTQLLSILNSGGRGSVPTSYSTSAGPAQIR